MLLAMANESVQIKVRYPHILHIFTCSVSTQDFCITSYYIKNICAKRLIDYSNGPHQKPVVNVPFLWSDRCTVRK